MSRMPFWLAYKVSDMLYIITYYLFGYRKKVVFNNLRLVFPEKSEKEITIIAKEFYKHFGDILMETVKAFAMSNEEMYKRYHYKNPEIFQELFDKNKSIILMGSHYANWEWIVHVSNFAPHKSYGTYSKLSNQYFDKLIRDSRGRHGGYLITAQETIPIIKNNTENKILGVYGLVSDQSPVVQKTHYWREFMGVKVPIHTGAEAIAKKYDLAVVFFDVDKIKRGYYEVTFKLLTEDTSKFEKFELTNRFIDLVEEQIKRKPSLYFWSHRRWKHKDKAPLN
jgi:KDO2-lipid IV(A) lauroyltransferase